MHFKHWNRLPSEVVESPPPEASKKQLDIVLNAVVHWQGGDQSKDGLDGLFSNLNDSMIQRFHHSFEHLRLKKTELLEKGAPED